MRASEGHRGKFILAHADALYSNGILESFLSGLANLLELQAIERDGIEIRFLNGEPDRRLVRELGLEENVVYTRILSKFGSTLSCLAQSDALLFIQRGACNGYIPEKFFQLLTLRTRVLAVVPNPLAYEEYASVENGVYIVENRNQANIAKTFLQLYRDWKENPVREAEALVVRQVWTVEQLDSGERVIRPSARNAA